MKINILENYFLYLFLDHHCLLYPIVEILFFTDKGKYSKEVFFSLLSLSPLSPLSYGTGYFTDESKNSRKLHFLKSFY